MEEQEYLAGHFRDLAEQSFQNNIYTFSGFLGDAQLAVFMRMKSELQYAGITISGGTEYAQRVMVRFGNPKEFGYDQEFPIACLNITPLSAKFGEDLSHRDYLGALMSLGIERELLGDILIRDRTAFVFCAEHIVPYIEDHLTRIRHTNISIKAVRELQPDLQPELKDITLIAASERLDAVISQVFHLSRSRSQALFSSGKVFVNGEECDNRSYLSRSEDRISVRGFGKFIYDGTEGLTGKGRCRIHIRLYI